MEDRRAAGACRHPGGTAGEGCSVTRESRNEAPRRHTRHMEVGVSARHVSRHDGTGIRADAAARGSISRRAHEQGGPTAKWRQSGANLPGSRQARCTVTKEGAAMMPWDAGVASPLRVRPVTYDFAMSPDPKIQLSQCRRNRRGRDFGAAAIIFGLFCKICAILCAVKPI